MSNFAPFNFNPNDEMNQSNHINQNNHNNQSNNNQNNNQNNNFGSLVPELTDFSAPNIGFGNIDINQFQQPQIQNQNNMPQNSFNASTQSNVISLEDINDFSNRLQDNQDKLVIIYFTAKWCGPCKSISPYYAELSGEFTNCIFLKCDVDECQDVSDACNISSMPTFIFIKNMNKLEKFSGVDRIKLRMVIEQNN